MNALLLNPWIYDFAAYDLWLKPFGLLRVGAFLREWRWEVEVVDCLDRFHPRLPEFSGGRYPRRDRFGCGKYYMTEVTRPSSLNNVDRRYFRYGLPLELFRDVIGEVERPDLILVGSTMTYWYPGYFLAIEMAREYFPGIPVILGGIYPALCPDHARNYSGADALHTDGGFAGLAKIMTELGFHSPLLPPGLDITPAYDLLSNRSALAVRTGLGCPYSCSYCAASLLEPELLQREPDTVATEIEEYVQNYQTTDIAFYDNALLVRSDTHLNRILSLMIRRKITCRFHTPNGLHARLLSEKTAGLLKESGFIGPRLSLESSQKARQKKTGGKVENRDLIQAIDYLEDAGFKRSEISVYLMFGLPGQRPDEVETDINFVHGLGTSITLAAFSPIPGTRDYAQLRNEGIIVDEMDPLLQNNTIFCLRQKIFSSDRIRDLRKMAAELNRGLEP
jgi:Radical SAM superfamily